MPSNLVKTPKDERLWNKAKDLAAHQGHEEDYAYITGIFQRMKGERTAGTRRANFQQARAKLLMRDGLTSSREPSWVWVPLSGLKADEVGLLLRAEAVLGVPNKAQTFGDWWDRRKREGFTTPIGGEGSLPPTSTKGISIPPENVERAASRLRDYELPSGRSASTRTASDMFVVPYRFAPVKVLPPDPAGVALREDPHPLTGYVVFQGMKIDLENLAGSYREGKGWRTYMNYPYGEFRGSLGVDNDPLDVYVGPNALSPLAVVIHQHDPETGEYDEDKVMVGFDTEQDAIQAYLRQYDRPGFYVEGRHRTLPVAALSAWMYREENQGRPVTASKRPRMAGYQTKKAGSVESAFYKVLATPTAIQELGEEKLTKLSEVLVGMLREAATVDWQKREPVRARLRNLIRAMMRRYGYPTDNQDRVVDSVLRQTAKFFPGT